MLAGMAEQFGPRLGGKAADDHGTDHGVAQPGTQVGDGALQAAHLGAFAVGNDETVTAQRGWAIASPAPGPDAGRGDDGGRAEGLRSLRSMRASARETRPPLL